MFHRWCKMRIADKEDDNQKIVLEFDKKGFKEFLRTIKIIGRDIEAKTNVNKHSHIVAINTILKPNMKVKGWCSRCRDLKHVTFLDYDNTLFWLVKEELELLIKKHNLSPFYVFTTHEEVKNDGETTGNYMAICLTKKPFFEVIELQRGTHTDVAHRIVAMSYAYKTHVLRLSGKGNKGRPKFKCVVGDLNKEHTQEISNAHLEGLNQLYPKLPSIKYKEKDEYKVKDLWLTQYMTGST